MISAIWLETVWEVYREEKEDQHSALSLRWDIYFLAGEKGNGRRGKTLKKQEKKILQSGSTKESSGTKETGNKKEVAVPGPASQHIEAKR